MRYQIQGDILPVVVCRLEAGESMITEKGAMSWMSPNIEMDTNVNGGIGGAFGRMFSGESIFQNRYTAKGPSEIAFASSFPGTIRALQISPGHSYIVQKSGFLAAEEGVDLSIHFHKKLGAGFFGGEGFIMQKLSGHGTAFIEIDGSVVEYDLAAHEQMIIDTGHLALMDETCQMDIKSVPGIKNALFGGEGLFNTTVTGPGRIVLQTHPIARIAGVLAPYLPSSKQ